MKTISHPLFIGLSVIYALYYSVKFSDIVLPIAITSFLADLLSVFIVNTIALWIVRKITKQPTYEFSIWMILTSVVLFSLFFEGYLPNVNAYYVADYLDVVCYMMSGAGYLIWRKNLYT